MKLVHNGTDWSLVNGNKTILSQKIRKTGDLRGLRTGKRRYVPGQL